MNCEWTREWLTAYALGDLDATAAAEVRTHLEKCDGCRAALREIEPTLDMLRDALAATRLRDEAPSLAEEQGGEATTPEAWRRRAPSAARLSAASRARIMAAVREAPSVATAGGTPSPASAAAGRQPRTARAPRRGIIRWVTVTHSSLVRAAALFLVGFIVLGLLMSTVVMNFSGKQEHSMVSATRAAENAIRTAVDMYEVDTGHLPASLDDLTVSDGSPNWSGPYLSGGGVPRDAWGQPFNYEVHGDNHEVKSSRMAEGGGGAGMSLRGQRIFGRGDEKRSYDVKMMVPRQVERLDEIKEIGGNAIGARTRPLNGYVQTATVTPQEPNVEAWTVNRGSVRWMPTPAPAENQHVYARWGDVDEQLKTPPPAPPLTTESKLEGASEKAAPALRPSAGYYYRSYADNTAGADLRAPQPSLSTESGTLPASPIGGEAGPAARPYVYWGATDSGTTAGPGPAGPGEGASRTLTVSGPSVGGRTLNGALVGGTPSPASEGESKPTDWGWMAGTTVELNEEDGRSAELAAAKDELRRAEETKRKASEVWEVRDINGNVGGIVDDSKIKVKTYDVRPTVAERVSTLIPEMDSEFLTLGSVPSARTDESRAKQEIAKNNGVVGGASYSFYSLAPPGDVIPPPPEKPAQPAASRTESPGDKASYSERLRERRETISDGLKVGSGAYLSSSSGTPTPDPSKEGSAGDDGRIKGFPSSEGLGVGSATALRAVSFDADRASGVVAADEWEWGARHGGRPSGEIDASFAEVTAAQAEQLGLGSLGKLQEPVAMTESLGGAPSPESAATVARTPASTRTRKPDDADKRVLEKLQNTIIPEVDFRGANINDVVTYLQQAGVEFDASAEAQKGVNMTLNLRRGGQAPAAEAGAEGGEDAGTGELEVPQVTFKARDISVLDTLKTVTEVTGLKYRVADGRIVVMPFDAPNGPILRRTYDVPADVAEKITKGLEELSAEVPARQKALTDDTFWKETFKRMGVEWPVGSSIKYSPTFGKLIAANTADNLDAFEESLADLRDAVGDVSTAVTNAASAELARIEAEKKAREEAEAKAEAERKAQASPPAETDLTGPRFKAFGVNPFIQSALQPFSTFSIDVDTASYTLARNYMSRGFLPPAEAVRTEEFVNFFDYAYKAPENETFRVYVEGAPSRFGHGLQLLKIGVKGKRLGREEERPVMLTLLIDTSGSMNQPDRLDLAKKSLRLLVEKLAPRDRVAIVQYDSHARLVLEPTPASDKKTILAALDALQCSGSTNLEEGMERAYVVAAQGFVSKAENRVLLISDGVANLGNVAAEDILKKIDAYRKQGIFLSVFGVGMGTYDDTMLETLANKGDGAYGFIDSVDEAKRLLVDDMAATLNTIAADVKIQVEFNPSRVKHYRQLGYENRQLKTEDFRNDAVDAGEVGSGQAVTALYEVEVSGVRFQVSGEESSTDTAPKADVTDWTTGGRGEWLGVVRVRYRRTDNGKAEEIERPITPADMASSFEQADVRFRLAAGVAEFSEILRASPFAAGSRFADAAEVLRPVAMELSLDGRVQELSWMVQQAEGMGRGDF